MPSTDHNVNVENRSPGSPIGVELQGATSHTLTVIGGDESSPRVKLGSLEASIKGTDVPIKLGPVSASVGGTETPIKLGPLEASIKGDVPIKLGPVSASVGGTETPIKLGPLEASIKGDVPIKLGPVSASVGGAETPIKLAPLKVEIAHIRFLPDLSIDVCLFGIRIFRIKITGSARVSPGQG